MKRFLIILLALMMLTLCACRKIEKEDPPATDATTGAVTTEAPADTADETKADAPAPGSDEGTAAGDTTEQDTSSAAAGRITEDEAVAAGRAYLGETDPDTGYRYSFTYRDIFLDTDTGTQYHRIRVAWYLEEDDRYATCGHLLVTLDGSSVQKFDW